MDRDVFQVNYLTSNVKDGHVENLKYSAEIKEWNERNIKVKFDFKDPRYASQGINKDSIVLLIRDKDIFRSKVHGRSIPETGISLLW